MTADLALVWIQARRQLLGYARNRRAVIFGVAMPIILLVLFNSIFVQGSDSVEVANHQVAASAYFTGGMLAYSMLLSGFTSMAMSLVSLRETGELKRRRGTPVPGWTFIAAMILRTALLIGAVTILMLAISHFAYDVAIPAGSFGQVFLYFALGTTVFAAVGIAATAAVTNIDSASGLLPFVAFLLSFISSIFVPLDQLPEWLADIGRIFPVYHVAAGIQTALAQGGSHPIDFSNLAVLAVWGVGATVIATRSFRWEPQGDD